MKGTSLFNNDELPTNVIFANVGTAPNHHRERRSTQILPSPAINTQFQHHPTIKTENKIVYRQPHNEFQSNFSHFSTLTSNNRQFSTTT
jgi:hypothetical protein